MPDQADVTSSSWSRTATAGCASATPSGRSRTRKLGGADLAPWPGGSVREAIAAYNEGHAECCDLFSSLTAAGLDWRASRGRVRRFRAGAHGPAPADDSAADAGRARPGATAASRCPLASMPKIDAAAILDTTTRMSSDKFQGRAPGTVGEEITVGYLEMQFKELGLQPGNPDGTYIQKVPLVGITGAETKPLTFAKGSETLPAEVEGRSGGVVEARGRRRRRSPTATSSSPATASKRPSTAGTTSRTST